MLWPGLASEADDLAEARRGFLQPPRRRHGARVGGEDAKRADVQSPVI
jgi:hypothetical protein